MIKFIDHVADLERVIPEIMQYPSWGCDTETTGLDPYTDKIVTFQIGREDVQYVIDARVVPIEPLRPFLESKDHKKVFHNGKFDYKMIKGNYGVETENIRDTFLAEKCLQAGRQKGGFSLDKILEKRLYIIMSKEERMSFGRHSGPFTKDQIEYAAKDVRHSLTLCKNQIVDMEKEGLISTWLLECRAVPCFGDMELKGLLLDKDKWLHIKEDNLILAKTYTAEMDEFSKNFFPVDLFGKVNINYGSPDQVLKLLKAMKVKVPSVQSDGRSRLELIQNTSDESLKKIKKYKIVELIKKYRSAMVRVNTFGDSYIDAIHPKTGRIHYILNQYGTDTGRPAKAGDSPINPLNTPRDKVFRNAFIADEGWTIETDDYSGCELRIWAEISGDPALREAFEKKMDVHCMVASRLYGVEVTKRNENKHLRTPAKSLNFGIAYGMRPTTLYYDINAAGMEVTFQEAKDLYFKYTKKEFKTGVDYLRNKGREAREKGVLASISGRRRYWVLPDPMNHERYPGGISDPKYRGRCAAIENEGGNFLIQSVNADITKSAMVAIRDYKKNNGIRTEIINQVYDEIVTTTHKDDVAEFHPVKQRIMIESAQKYLKIVPMEVDGEVLPYWTK